MDHLRTLQRHARRLPPAGLRDGRLRRAPIYPHRAVGAGGTQWQ
jgi:hypothetical protein